MTTPREKMSDAQDNPFAARACSGEKYPRVPKGSRAAGLLSRRIVLRASSR